MPAAAEAARVSAPAGTGLAQSWPMHYAAAPYEDGGRGLLDHRPRGRSGAGRGHQRGRGGRGAPKVHDPTNDVNELFPGYPSHVKTPQDAALYDAYLQRSTPPHVMARMQYAQGGYCMQGRNVAPSAPPPGLNPQATPFVPMEVDRVAEEGQVVEDPVGSAQAAPPKVMLPQTRMIPGKLRPNSHRRSLRSGEHPFSGEDPDPRPSGKIALIRASDLPFGRGLTLSSTRNLSPTRDTDFLGPDKGTGLPSQGMVFNLLQLNG